jgi:hypothetical protein
VRQRQRRRRSVRQRQRRRRCRANVCPKRFNPYVCVVTNNISRRMWGGAGWRTQKRADGCYAKMRKGGGGGGRREREAEQARQGRESRCPCNEGQADHRPQSTRGSEHGALCSAKAFIRAGFLPNPGRCSKIKCLSIHYSPPNPGWFYEASFN